LSERWIRRVQCDFWLGVEVVVFTGVILSSIWFVSPLPNNPSSSVLVGSPLSSSDLREWPTDRGQFLALNNPPCFYSKKRLPDLLNPIYSLRQCPPAAFMLISRRAKWIGADPLLRKSSRWRTRSEGEDEIPVRVCAHPWWLIWSCCGASFGVRSPVNSISTPYMLVEGRPFFYLQAMKPKGRQRYFFMEPATWSLGSLAIPSGVVPGDGEATPVEKKLWTRLRFSSLFWGPLCKSQGLVCYFLLVLGPDVLWFVPAYL
jgi:hypothetical protein